MIASVAPINSGFALTDPSDPRYQYFLGVKHRFGKFLHDASVSLRAQGEENTVDAVQILVRVQDTKLKLDSIYLGQFYSYIYDGVWR